jgi:hypothetical protein
MGIHKHYECNTSLWNFPQQLVRGQHYVAFFGKQTKCHVHSMCNWGENGHLQEVTPSLYGFAKELTKEQDVTNTKKKHLWVAP